MNKKINKFISGILIVILSGCSFGLNISSSIKTSPMDILDILASNVELKNVEIRGRVVSKSEKAMIVSDGFSKILFQSHSRPLVEIGDTVVISGNTSIHGKEKYQTQYFDSSNATYSVQELDVEEENQNIVKWKYTNVDSFSGNVYNYVMLSLNVSLVDGEYIAEKMNSKSVRRIRIKDPLGELIDDIDFSTPTMVKVSGYPYCVTNNDYVDFMVNNVELIDIDSLTPKVIDIYASNDFHGRVSKNNDKNEPGIAKLATYLDLQKEKNEDGFIYINSGDLWQDTYESGYNKGKLLTECLDAMECETMSLGNHEFDWGIDTIRENKKLVSYTKFLGANIRNYPNTNEQVDFAEPYKIVERDGLKIGIIGAIGKEQITSITSSIWEDITFLDHESIVKSLSDELRVEKGCDIVILSIHADESVSGGNTITQFSPVSNEKYVDAVFCAHTHQREVTEYNGVPFVQAGAYGKYLSHVQLEYSEGEVKVLAAKYEGYGAMQNLEDHSEVKSIVDKYFTNDYITQKNKTHGRVEGASSINSDVAGRILAKATYDKLKEAGIDCDIVINNGSRDDTVSTGEMTSEKIFNMIPFTNQTLVAKNIKGSDIIAECVTYPNPYYMPDSSLTIESDKYYTVACIDYLLLHKNTYRYYNYFSSYDNKNLIYTIKDYPNEIVEEYLQDNKVINTNDYYSKNYTCLA